MSSTKDIRIASLIHKHGGHIYLKYLFADTEIRIMEDTVLRERRQTVDGRTFVICSVFDRFADRTAAEMLSSLVELEAEKEHRNLH